jgi:hypothetical protein
VAVPHGLDLNRAFMSGGRPAGISFTAVATQFDQLVTPAPDAARLDGATNLVIQDICPGRTVDHFAIVGDAVGYAIAIDAFTNAGTADAARVDRASCAQTFPPGAEQERFDPQSITNAVIGLTTAPQLDREPPLVCPFDPAACAAGISGTPAPSGTQGTSRRSPMRLTRTCVGRRPPARPSAGGTAGRASRGVQVRHAGRRPRCDGAVLASAEPPDAAPLGARRGCGPWPSASAGRASRWRGPCRAADCAGRRPHAPRTPADRPGATAARDADRHARDRRARRPRRRDRPGPTPEEHDARERGADDGERDHQAEQREHVGRRDGRRAYGVEGVVHGRHDEQGTGANTVCRQP